MATELTRAVKEGEDDSNIKEGVEGAEEVEGDVAVVEVVLPFCSTERGLS